MPEPIFMKLAIRNHTLFLYLFIYVHAKEIQWPQSENELYRPRGRHLSVKLVPTFVDRGCHVVSVTDSYGRILGFLDRSSYI
jgi:CBS-domain-containing membrane protein